MHWYSVKELGTTAWQLTTPRWVRWLLLDERRPQPVLCLSCVWLALSRLRPSLDCTNLIFWDGLPLKAAACRIEVQLQGQDWMTFQRQRQSKQQPGWYAGHCWGSGGRSLGVGACLERYPA